MNDHHKDFGQAGQLAAGFTQSLFHQLENLPALPRVAPGQALGSLEKEIPDNGQPLEQILDDFRQHILPGMTVWNHPGFMAYFNSTASPASLLSEMLIASTNSNCMNWLSCPAGTELEQLAISWLAQLLGLPENMWGIIFEGASLSSFHALAAAREKVLGPAFREKGWQPGRKPMRAYTTAHAHSSIAKALMALGAGKENIIYIPVDEAFRMQPEALEEQIRQDLKEGFQPLCVVATLGTTSCTAMDPVSEIAGICEIFDIWLHVDAAHAGPVAILESHRSLFEGWEKADSITVNPHKWMFLSIDTSVLFMQERYYLREAFSLTPDYLKTAYDEQVTNYYDYGLTLGRRFKALKLWANIRYFGRRGYQEIIGRHLEMAQLLRSWLEKEPGFELLAPTPLSTLCFRYVPEGETLTAEAIDVLNEHLLAAINRTGQVFLTPTRLNGKFTIRLVIASLWTEEEHVKKAWKAIRECAGKW
ncbi:MAG: hypothetical protein H6558_03790 [Lewinellaceae bacterium]|nr:hypothetical protein [Lewinellaceae bacterium]MCB9286749.1 hypothetical protein [Lewinellaceae bacterium]